MVTNVDGLARCGLRAYERAHGLGTGLNTTSFSQARGWAHTRTVHCGALKIGGAAAGRKRKMYPWGNALTPDGTHRANVWQGAFPTSNSVEDGYAGVAPVLAFGPQNGNWECTT